MSDTSDRVKQLLIEWLFVEPAKVTDDAMLVMDLGADSLDGIEIAMALEEAFDIEIPDDEIRDHMRVKDVVALVERLAA